MTAILKKQKYTYIIVDNFQELLRLQIVRHPFPYIFLEIKILVCEKKGGRLETKQRSLNSSSFALIQSVLACLEGRPFLRRFRLNIGFLGLGDDFAVFYNCFVV